MLFTLTFQVIDNLVDYSFESDNIELSESNDEIEEEDVLEDGLLESFYDFQAEHTEETTLLSIESMPVFSDAISIKIPSPPPELA